MTMKVLIVYMSIHHQNTSKIAQAMARVLDAQMIHATDANAEEVGGRTLSDSVPGSTRGSIMPLSSISWTHCPP